MFLPPRSFSRLAFALFVAFGCVAGAKQVSIHDPVMAKDGKNFVLFSTGPGITFYLSEDMHRWTLGGRVFPGEPTWAKSVAPNFNGHIWAPDIIFKDGKYYLYYSVSGFGKNASGIGVTINKTLDPSSPDYKWEDQGMLLRSVPHRDLWNAIDPAVIFDDEGTPWMSFGSFWSGLKLVKLDASLTKLAQPEEWYSIAKRERSVLANDLDAGTGEIEAPFLFKKGPFYYLFASWDKCCRGKASNYKLVMGRSENIRGPYLDKDGKDMAKGGGTLLLAGNERWPGLGHNSAYTFDGKDFLVLHAYEAADDGLQKLKVMEIKWDQDGWPVVDPQELETYQSELVK